jgi:hypothetical protein
LEELAEAEAEEALALELAFSKLLAMLIASVASATAPFVSAMPSIKS